MHAGLEGVRTELHGRIAAIGARTASRVELAQEIDAIRAIAHRAGMHPAVTVAHLLDDALSRGEHGPLVHGWLSVLNDAVASARHDAAACDTFAAACAVRFNG
ncbi:hypothetical protein [Sphingomonas lenta]|uniref:Uncharacterized protein n=1 Tax=Sphingomonas lenta TaxID=1141887 RepID=A0A2A2SEG9_9SPHN|nr:hypothetical protein [Sphingomonas lenta]PAX07580.1 hypothetical protein CKY28_07950 [Sphingomonas lenta]